MVNHLYIIGNGFDKHHDIPSGYQDYRKWLEDNESWDILETIDDLFGYTDDDWWTHFEDNLASVETLQIATEEAFLNYPNFSSDSFKDRDWYDAELSVEIKVRDAYNDIVSSFNKWVLQLPYGNIKKRIRLETGSVFMTFNYSHTLEKLYGIHPNKILHIHGEAGVDDELVLGHGLKYGDIEKRMGESVDEGDYVLQCAKDAAVYSVASHRKEVERIIDNHKRWFDDLNHVTHIHILGHSLGDVDLPYFYKVFESCDKDNIFVEYSFRDIKERDKAESIVQFALIPLCRFRSIDMRDLQVLKERYP